MSSPSAEGPRLRVVHLLLLALLVLVAYGASHTGDFVWDDRMLIVENDLVRDADRLGELFTSSFWDTGDRHDRFRAFFRPVVGLSYFIDHSLWGLRPVGYHITNTLVHLLCCMLVYAVARGERLGAWCAFSGAALFAVHPVHVESVAWISGRTDLLCTLLALAAFALQRQATGARRPRLAMLLAIVLFLLAMFSKEMAATLPLLIGIDRWLATRRLRPAAAAAWPFVAALVLYAVLRYGLIGGVGPSLYTLDSHAWLATAVFAIARYLTLLTFPVGLDAHYPYPTIDSLLSPLVLVSAVMLALVVYAAKLLSRRSPAGLFWLVWATLSLAPVLLFGRFGDVIMADRFLYLPSVGLALLVTRALYWVQRQRSPAPARGFAFAISILLALFSVQTVSRARVWNNDFALFSDMRRTSPGSALVRCNLGMVLYQRGETESAIREYREALALEPTYAIAHNNLAVAFQGQGRNVEALRHYMAALELVPWQLEASVNAGHLLTNLGQAERGIATLRDAVRRYPRNPHAHYVLAEALERSGRGEEALALLTAVRRLAPDYPNARYLRGKILYDNGRLDQAAREMQAFLDLRLVEEDAWTRAARRVITQASRGQTLPAALGPDTPR